MSLNGKNGLHFFNVNIKSDVHVYDDGLMDGKKGKIKVDSSVTREVDDEEDEERDREEDKR